MAWDVIVIGGSVAGLSAALLLGRCKRNVLVFDAGEPRNRRSPAMHGFLSRDGIAPLEFLEISRRQLREYPNVCLRKGKVVAAEKTADEFAVLLENGERAQARMLLLANGIADELPPLPGIEKFYGTSVHHCPYCAGWECRDQPIAIYGEGRAGVALALEMLGWSADLALCTGGDPIESAEKKRLIAKRIPVYEEPIEALEGAGDRLAGIRFKGGGYLACTALFFRSTQKGQGDLVRGLGCRVDEAGCIDCERDVCTNVPGLYAAGNTTTGLQLAIVAAAEGTKAAWAINQAMLSNSLRIPSGDAQEMES